MARNKTLNKARQAQQDEYYTRLEDISAELKHYRKHFKDKVVLCNCDDPYESNFFKYFALNFNKLGLKKLICTCYKGSPVIGTQLSFFDGMEASVALNQKANKKAYKIVITEVPDITGDGALDIGDVEYLIQNDKNVLTELKEDGDFRSKECRQLLKEANIVVTNPPFSMFREYIAQLVEYKKKFLVIGNVNAVVYKEIFPLIKNNKMWFGYNSPPPKEFRIPSMPEDRSNTYTRENGEIYAKFGNTTWFTNLDIKKRHEKLELYKKYSSDEYPGYDNYAAIEVSKINLIPRNFSGAMGVPITLLDKYNPDQFEILGITDRDNNSGLKTKEYTREDSAKYSDLNRRAVIKQSDGTYKTTYARLLIRKKEE